MFEDVSRDRALFDVLQKVLSGTVNQKWTRDRGCSVHGVRQCDAACALKHQSKVPRDYKLVKVEKNHNDVLWKRYENVRKHLHGGHETPIFSNGHGLARVLQMTEQGHNEWFVFHGASRTACDGICNSNFRLDLSGQGATKFSGAQKRPLYGWGVYFAESSTKADEYGGDVGRGQHCMLLCLVIGGNALQTTEDGIKEDVLNQQVHNGHCHSVFGERRSTMHKPFNEICVYSPEQVFPAFVLTYTRCY